MSETLLIGCPVCLRTNRLPPSRLHEQPNCGRCKAPLFSGHPVAVTDQSFEALVARTGIPILLDCWAPWCGPCLQFAPVFEAAAAQLEPQFRLLKLDTEANPTTAARLGIRSIPTLIVLRDGQELARRSGAMPLPALLSWVRQVNQR
jgi:thioredoxin 2